MDGFSCENLRLIKTPAKSTWWGVPLSPQAVDDRQEPGNSIERVWMGMDNVHGLPSLISWNRYWNPTLIWLPLPRLIQWSWSIFRKCISPSWTCWAPHAHGLKTDCKGPDRLVKLGTWPSPACQGSWYSAKKSQVWGPQGMPMFFWHAAIHVSNQNTLSKPVVSWLLCKYS